MGETWGLSLPTLGPCPGEEVGDSAAVESSVPWVPGDLRGELTWGHQAFHWPWGEGPGGWAVPQAARRLRPQPPARAPGAAAAAASASSVSASWRRRRGRERGLLFPLPGRRRGPRRPVEFPGGCGSLCAVSHVTRPAPPPPLRPRRPGLLPRGTPPAPPRGRGLSAGPEGRRTRRSPHPAPVAMVTPEAPLRDL